MPSASSTHLPRSSDPAPGAAHRVLYLGLDSADPAVRRRVDQLRRAGVLAAACTFHRQKSDCGWEPDYDLGYVRNRSFLSRIPGLCVAFARLVRLPKSLRSASVIMARNLDILLLAVMLKAIGLSRAAIIYEVLDIHVWLLGDGAKARLMRWIEARLMRSVRLILVSSKDFETEYFARFFAEVPPVVVVENRLFLDDFFDAHPDQKAVWSSPERTKTSFDRSNVTIGWVGALRCRRSAEILREAVRADPRLTLLIAGRPTFCGENEFRALFGGLANVRFWGRYSYPADLYRIYSLIDLNWCVDLADTVNGMAESNAAWLLPNRLYEGGYFGVPQIALHGTATGRYVAETGIGWTLSGDPAEALNRLLAALDRDAYQAVKQRCTAIMDSRFKYSGDIEILLKSLSSSGLKGVQSDR